jgi:cadmium resistance protein CadD (predicted permease)
VINSMMAAVATSVTTFAATSVDDLFLLTVFFAHRIPERKIVLGQYLGFGAIISVALIGIFFALSLPHHWIRLLGLLPIGIGIRHFVHAAKGDTVRYQQSNSGIMRIALLIFSNGADNIAIYLPFFLIGRAYLWSILSMYAFLIAAWCLLAKWLGNHPAVLHQLDRHGHWVVPAVFVGLGVYILNS